MNKLNARPSAAKTLSEMGLPTLPNMLERLRDLESRSGTAKLIADSVRTGVFQHPNGNTVDLQSIEHSEEQLALLAYLSSQCDSSLSIEIGFGLGITAGIMLSARRDAGRSFQHLIFDPYGLAGRENDIENYLRAEFGPLYQRQYERSQYGLSSIATLSNGPQCDLIFVDGDHHFEGVMSDFFVADKLLNLDGYIVFDDADYPVIETVVQFIQSNRLDYVLVEEVPNTALIKKIDQDHRAWNHFRPFPVAERRDWTPGP